MTNFLEGGASVVRGDNNEAGGEQSAHILAHIGVVIYEQNYGAGR